MVREKYGVQLSTQEKGAAPADDQSRQEFRAGHHPSAHSAENGSGLDCFSSGRSPGHLGADRVPRQAAVRRGGAG